MAFSFKPRNIGSISRTVDEGARRKAGVTIASSLRYENVSHAYGEKQTLQDINLEIAPGEVVCLLGPSGSGKTTLLRLAAGLVSPTEGSVYINGAEVSNQAAMVPPERRGVGLVFQDFALFPHMSVLKNVEFGLTQLSRVEKVEHAMRMLETVGLGHEAMNFPASLSGGEQQRVALARALAPKPGILLMDEPFSGLDARLREAVREETLALLRDTRSTVLIVTHDPEEAMKIGDRIVLMQNGEIVQAGTCEELYRTPVNFFAARFFSELNCFKGMASGSRIESEIGTFERPETGREVAQGAEYLACVRPSDFVIENVKLKDGTQIVLSAESLKEGTQVCLPLDVYVVGRRQLGDGELLRLAVPGDQRLITIRTARLEGIEGAETVRLRPKAEKVLLFPA